MTLFKPNFLPKQKMYQFWVKFFFEGCFGWSKCSKMLKNAILEHSGPPKHLQKKFDPKLMYFLVSLYVWLKINKFQASRKIGLKMRGKTDFSFVNFHSVYLFSNFKPSISLKHKKIINSHII